MPVRLEANHFAGAGDTKTCSKLRSLLLKACHRCRLLRTLMRPHCSSSMLQGRSCLCPQDCGRQTTTSSLLERLQSRSTSLAGLVDRFMGMFLRLRVYAARDLRAIRTIDLTGRSSTLFEGFGSRNCPSVVKLGYPASLHHRAATMIFTFMLHLKYKFPGANDSTKTHCC
eukprot:1487195-Rhodomonas_salina.2